MIDLQKPVAMMTAAELLEVFQYATNGQNAVRARANVYDNDDFIYGNVAMADFLHVSRTTIHRLNHLGLLDGCSFRVGNKIVFEKSKVLENLRKANKLPWQKIEN